jgi:hypothetical protein
MWSWRASGCGPSPRSGAETKETDVELERKDTEMTEREIAYDRTGEGPVGLCPTCGRFTMSRLACGECFATHTFPRAWPARDINVVEARDTYYALGVRLRASGALPPLAKPGAPPVCKDCKAQPCDCGERIWGRRYRAMAGYAVPGPREGWILGSGCARSAAVGFRPDDGTYEHGPIQRITDPPFEFPKRGTTSFLSLLPVVPAPPQQNVAVGIDVARDKAEVMAVTVREGRVWIRDLSREFVFGPDAAKATLPGSVGHISSEGHLAKLVWMTDPRVGRFIARVSDCIMKEDPRHHVFNVTRYARAREKAWERNEGGWRAEAEARAKDMFVVAEG